MRIPPLSVSYEELKSLVLEALRRKPKTQYVEVLIEVAGLSVTAGLASGVSQSMAGGSPFDLSPIDQDRVLEIIWDLVIERILTIGRDGANAGWPFMNVTTYGKQVLASRDPVPHDPAGYLAALQSAVPTPDPIIITYLQEALKTYNIRALLSSTIALGCASEKAILLLIDAFGGAIADTEKAKAFQSTIDGAFIKRKFDEFRKRLDQSRQQLPRSLSDGLDIILNGIFEMIRTNRNDAGHPTGMSPSREQVYASLQLFISYLQRVYQLIEHFGANKVNL